MKVMYCKKCGRVVTNIKKCDICGSETYEVPTGFLIAEGAPVFKNGLESKFIEEYVKSSPEFDPQLYARLDEKVAERMAEYDRTMAIVKAIDSGVKPRDAFNGNFTIVKCPSCGSTNVSKIGFFDRAISTGIFGLASSKIGKTHKCNSCGTMW